MRSRKSATASSDVNEFLSLYFIKHPNFTDAKTFMIDISKLGGDIFADPASDPDNVKPFTFLKQIVASFD